MLHLKPFPGRSTRFIDSRLPPVTPPRAEAFLHALALERGRCRQTSEALKDAHETILTLEAQVARREAELESRDHQHIASVKPVPQKRSLVETLCAKVPDVPLSEVIHSLSMAEENNHVLEREVSELSNHVGRPPPPIPFPNSVVHVTETNGRLPTTFYLSWRPDLTSAIGSPPSLAMFIVYNSHTDKVAPKGSPERHRRLESPC